MLSVSGGAINATFTYDPNGNQTSGNGLSTLYTSYDKPWHIMRGGTWSYFKHDSEHQRYWQQTSDGRLIVYLHGGAAGVSSELIYSGSGWQWTNYLVAGENWGQLHLSAPSPWSQEGGWSGGCPSGGARGRPRSRPCRE